MKSTFLMLLLSTAALLLRAQETPPANEFAPAIDGQTIKLLPQTEGVAPCDVFTEIFCKNNISSTTVGQGNDFFSYPGISGASFNGADRLFRLRVPAGQQHYRIVLEILTANVDLDLLLLTSCSPVNVGMFSAENNRSTGIRREVIDVNINGGSTGSNFFIMVDGKLPSDQGAFSLKINCNCTCSEPLSSQPDGHKFWGDDFGDYQLNARLTPQSSRWIPWTASATDAQVIKESVLLTEPNNQYAFFNGTASSKPDIIYQLANRNAGRFRLSWRMRVDKGKAGYYNLLHGLPNTSGSNEVYAYNVRFLADGKGQVEVSSGTGNNSTNAATFTYTQGRWFNVTNIVDIDRDIVELWLDDAYIGSWKFSLSVPASASATVKKTLAGINFYANTNNAFSIDNLCVWQRKSCIVTTIFAPVCTEKGEELANNGLARCELYTPAEMGTCPTKLPPVDTTADVCDFGGNFIDRGQRYSGQLDPSDDAPGRLTLLTGACGPGTKGRLYADVYTFYNEKTKSDGKPEDIIINYQSDDPSVRCNVFVCKDPVTCKRIDQGICIKNVPPNSSDPIPVGCDEFYYIVFSGGLGAKYNFIIVPEGFCPSDIEEIPQDAMTTGSISGGTGDPRFSRNGEAYKSCYSGPRSYAGDEKVYQFTIKEPVTITWTLKSTADIGMFLYSSVCGGTCLNSAEVVNGQDAVIRQLLKPGTYYLVVDKASANGQASFTITPGFIILIIDEFFCVGTDDDPNAHQVTVDPGAYDFSDNPEIAFLYENEDLKLKETANERWHGQLEAMPFILTPTLPVTPTDPDKCGYDQNELLKVFVAQRNGANRTFRQMGLAFTPPGVDLNTADRAFTSGRRSNIERMTPISVAHFGTQTESISLPALASTARLNFSTNKTWQVRFKNTNSLQDESYIPQPEWLTIDPNTSEGAARVRFSARANDGEPRFVYVEFYAVDQPYFIRHLLQVNQAGRTAPAPTPLEGDPDQSFAANSDMLHVFPNPTTGRLQLRLGLAKEAPVEIRLFDVLGRLAEVLQPLEMLGDQTLEFDLSGHANGLYRLEVIVDGQPMFRSVVVERR
jgi:hypothetical protein